jgi:hypothetical protein
MGARFSPVRQGGVFVPLKKSGLEAVKKSGTDLSAEALAKVD